MKDQSENGIRVTTGNKDVPAPWVLTNRQLEVPAIPVGYINTSPNGETVVRQLGIPDSEIEEWKKKHYSVLEIGSGGGAVFEKLFEQGIDVYALEPSFLYKPDPNDDIWMKAKALMSDPRYTDRIKAIKAVDAQHAFPNKKFEVAFAIGVNFQSFSANEYEVLSQISGVLAALNSTKTSYFIFETDERGEFHLNFRTANIDHDPSNSDKNKIKRFRLKDFLSDRKIKYTFKKHPKFVNPEVFGFGYALSIYKLTADGEDSATILSQALKEDVSQYTY